MIEVYFDGLCEPINPVGIAAYGYVILQDGEEINTGCGVIGEGKGMTNNVAEYSALVSALEWINSHNIADDIIIKGDSQLVIEQLNGNWKIKSETSKKFVPKIRQLLNGKKAVFKWIPREENSKADMLSRDAHKKYILKGVKNDKK